MIWNEIILKLFSTLDDDGTDRLNISRKNQCMKILKWCSRQLHDGQINENEKWCDVRTTDDTLWHFYWMENWASQNTGFSHKNETNHRHDDYILLFLLFSKEIHVFRVRNDIQQVTCSLAFTHFPAFSDSSNRKWIKQELTVFLLHRQRWRLLAAVSEKIGPSRLNQTLMFALHGIEHQVAEIIMFKGQHVHTMWHKNRHPSRNGTETKTEKGNEKRN